MKSTLLRKMLPLAMMLLTISACQTPSKSTTTTSSPTSEIHAKYVKKGDIVPWDGKCVDMDTWITIEKIMTKRGSIE
jgi:hypothetical protein